MKIIGKCIYLWFVALLFAFEIPVLAEPAIENQKTLEKLIDVLKDKRTLDANTYNDLKDALKLEEKILPLKAAVKDDAKGPKVDTDGKFQIASEDGNFSFRVGGRIHLDATFYDNDDNTNNTDSVDARRARLEIQGSMYKNWDWKLDYEFAQTSELKGGFRDAYVKYRFSDTPASLTIGQFKEYFGLESLNSSNDLPFVERSLTSRTFHDIAEATDGRRLGLGFNTNFLDVITISVGAFAKNVSGDSSDDAKDPLSAQTRVTISPFHDDAVALHAGLSANWIDLNDAARATLSAKPESKLGAESLISTGEITNVETFSRYGAEFGAIKGPFWTQGEFMLGDFSRKTESNVTFAGWHGDVGYILTGESRVYDFQKGTISNPELGGAFGNSGFGAFELAARLSGLDLSSKDIQGGRESNFSSGLNWYPNDNFRFMLTWTKVLEVKGGAYDNQEPSEILLRTQFNF